MDLEERYEHNNESLGSKTVDMLLAPIENSAEWIWLISQKKKKKCNNSYVSSGANKQIKLTWPLNSF
jgi:hypothetical protein